MDNLSTEAISLIAHTLGVDIYPNQYYKRDFYLPDKFSRNYFCCGNKDNSDYPLLKEAEDKGFMKIWNKFDNLYFSVTEKGQTKFRDWFAFNITVKFKKPSKSKQEYADYIHSECEYNNGFADWLNIQLPKMETRGSWHPNTEYRMKSTKYYGVNGDWFKTMKQAKASYKEALKEYKKREGIR